MKNLLLINGFGSGENIVNELLSKQMTDINIYLSYPLGVLTLAAWSRQELPDFDLQILDVPMDLHKLIAQTDRPPVSLDEFIYDELAKVAWTPDYIAVSMTFSNGHIPCLKMIQACKRIWPSSKLIVGGMHATTFTARILSEKAIDYLVRGPGDSAFIDLLRALESDADHQVKDEWANISFFDGLSVVTA